MEPHLILNLRRPQNSKGYVGYLKMVNHKGTSTHLYQLEFEIAKYTQGTPSIQDYYLEILNLWTKYDGKSLKQLSLKYKHFRKLVIGTSF